MNPKPNPTVNSPESTSMTRRRAIQLGLATAAFAAAGPGLRSLSADQPVVSPLLLIEEGTYPFQLPPLPYAYDALEPAIDAETMEIHHNRHHAAYVNNLNAALEGHPELHSKTLGELIAGDDLIPEDIRMAVRNNGGGHANHSLFWLIMSNPGTEPSAALSAAIAAEFGSREALVEQLLGTAAGQFGSGWGWFCLNADGNLEVVGLPNQDSPWRDGLIPLLGVDVWEHAYYLKYQNRRGDYLQQWSGIIDWDAVSRRYQQALDSLAA